MKQVDILQIEESWYDILKSYFDSLCFIHTIDALKEEYKCGIPIYPEKDDIFNAYNSCSFNNVKVVILGQDCYHGKGQAHGLAFSVKEGINLPPSLQNIIKELNSDLNINRTEGNLKDWEDQGVLLLNSILTVREHSALSHQEIGWQYLTDYTIAQLSIKKNNIVFILWGKHAQQKEMYIDKSKHLILKASHPSPFSARFGFFGCKHFSKTNKYLEEHGLSTIKWNQK